MGCDCFYLLAFEIGVPGSNNDINVNEQSPIWSDIGKGEFPSQSYKIGNQDETQLYFTADNIYPRFPIFMQSFGSNSCSARESFFSTRLESVRKDIERAFGILQARFACLKKPSLYWKFQDLYNEVMCCIVLHNMIVRDEIVHQDQSSDRSASYLPDPTHALQRSTSEYILSVSSLISNISNAQSLNKFIRLREQVMDNMYDQGK